MKRPFDVVTGGAGFIGSHLVRGLLARGRRVKIIDNLSTGRLENLSSLDLNEESSIQFVQADIRDTAAVAEVLVDCERVYHQAAIPSVQRSVDDPIETNSVNVDGTLNLLEAAKEAKVTKVVLASTCAVYGDSEELPKQESMAVNPLSPYAASKCCNELYARVFSGVYSLPSVCLRYFNVFGPRQDPASDYAAVVPRFITRMLHGQSPLIYGDGEQSRDFIFVENVVEANIRAGESDATALAVNIGCGQRTSLNQLVSVLNEILSSNFEPEYLEVRPGDIRHSEGDISLAREGIGFEPSIDFKTGLEKTIEYYRSQEG